MKVLLVSNYLPDAQQSMLRFAEVMAQGLRREGHQVQILHPPALLGRLVGKTNGMGKWLGYVDKYLLFLPALWFASRKSDVVHICDHSNAPYAFFLGGRAHLVTCHDLLAVRGGLGEDTDCPASTAGSLLQRAILSGLKRSSMVVCDSESTRSDLLRLGGQEMEERSRVVHLGLSQEFRPVEESACAQRLEESGNPMREPFLLMVGSALRRKNRETALQTLGLVRRTWDVKLVIAGERLTEAQRELAESMGVLSNIVEVCRPSDEVLEALYSSAHALLFPSRFEGFGWPVVEAQACGCPVICGDATSLPEVGGNAALLRHADDAEGFATDVIQLRDAAFRTAMIQRGRENVRRFTMGRMMDDYLAVYSQLSQRQENSGLVPDITTPVRQS